MTALPLGSLQKARHYINHSCNTEMLLHFKEISVLSFSLRVVMMITSGGSASSHGASLPAFQILTQQVSATDTKYRA
jgi:hypothetical protein